MSCFFIQVVSTSRTPGHTKHFQTVFLTRSIRLCDCPGLVFPSLVDRQLQVGKPSASRYEAMLSGLVTSTPLVTLSSVMPLCSQSSITAATHIVCTLIECCWRSECFSKHNYVVPQTRKLLLEISEDFFKNQKAIFKEAGGFLRTTLGLYIYSCFWSSA